MRKALLLAVLLLPLATAQAPQPWTVLNDNSDDVQIVAADQGQSVPNQAVTAADLLALDVVEAPDAFTFTLSVAGLDAGTEVQVMYETDFTHHDQVYRVRWYWANLPELGAGALARLMAYDVGEDSFYIVQALDAGADVAAGTLTTSVPRSLLLDTQGAAPFPGRTLEGFTTVSYGITRFASFTVMGTPVSGPYATDRMPDTGVGVVPVPVVLGISQTGHARLASDEPFRASNGEATTFVFEVNARNIGQADDVFRFQPAQVPAGWAVRMADSEIDIAAGANATVPVVVQTAFAHAHGSTARFVLEMHSVTDPASVGRVELGVYYPAIPQPAGHHDTVYFHSIDYTKEPIGLVFSAVFGTAFGFEAAADAYMNAAEQDDNDDGVPVRGDQCGTSLGGSAVETTYCWWISLEPALQMGLDVEADQVGSITVPLHSLAPMPGTRLRGSIIHYAPAEPTDEFFVRREATEILRIEPSAPVEIGADGEAVLEATIVPIEGVDVIPYVRGAGLELRLEVVTDRPDNVLLGPRLLPEMLPGGSMRLPLKDYADPVDEVFTSSNLHLMAVGPAQKPVNPGKTVVFTLGLHNAAELEDTYSIRVVGEHADWARVVGKGTVTLPADGGTEFKVAVTPPVEATDGERADLVIEVASQHDLATRGILRIVAEVDTDAEHEDESGQAATKDGQKAPGVHIALLVAGLVLLAKRRRT